MTLDGTGAAVIRDESSSSRAAAEPVPSRVPRVHSRLLVITYHFPPDGAVGGLRWSGLSKYLTRLGWEVHVITAADARGQAEVPGVHRHHRARRRTLNDRYKAIADRFRDRPAAAVSSDVASASESPTRPGAIASLVSSLRAGAGLALSLPDDGRGWVLPAGLAARDLLRQYAFDAVVTSGPPHSAHFAGVLATLGGSVPHIVDMRDPWIGTARNSPDFPINSRFLHSFFSRAEWLTFRRARSVVVNTREFAEDLRQRRPYLSVVHIPNGTDAESLPLRSAELFDGISIAYAGTVYLGRSFSALLGAIGSLVRDRPREAASVRLRIAGSMGPSQVDKLQAAMADQGLVDAVELRGVLPRSEALDLLRRSHLALVLAQGQPTQIPAKLYECVGLGVPTLVVAELDSAASQEARRIGALTVAPGDQQGMRRIFDDLIDGRIPTTINAAVPITYDALARVMEREIRRVGKRT